MIVVPSEYLVRIFAKFGYETVAIFNLIDLDRFEYRERTNLRPVFLSNRNLEAHYGVDDLLRAFAYIQREIPGAVLTVVGDGSQRNALENLASALHLANTNFTGRVEHDEINRHYSAVDIYLNASKVDNQPLSILEAFACGLPVVTTDAGGIPDIVTDEITGFLVPVGDHESLAKRALHLLTHQELAAPMIESGRAECTKYTWSVVGPEWVNVYHSVAEK
jgi:glycosyltransferase involved in cell wall biosynthesis